MELPKIWILYGLLNWIIPLYAVVLFSYSIIVQLSGLTLVLVLPILILSSLIIFISIRIIIAGLIARAYGLPKEGRYSSSLSNLKFLTASMNFQNTVQHGLKMLCIPETAELLLYKIFLKAKIGDVICTGRVLEPTLVEIGDGTVIGEGAIVSAHVNEGKYATLKKVKIGKNCVIGARSIIAPGVTIGDNTLVGAQSLVPKGMKLDSNSIYAGMPVKKIK